jgi:hypothetical protein
MSEGGGKVGRTIRRVEEASGNLPIVGGMIRAREEDARKAFQQATRNAASPPGLKESFETIDELSSAYSKLYDDTLDGFKKPIKVLSADDLVSSIGGDVPGATPTMFSKASVLFNDLLPLGSKTEILTARQAQQIESKLKATGHNYGSSLDPVQREQGQVIKHFAKKFADDWRGQLDQATGQSIKLIDKQFASFVPVRRAGAKATDLVDPENYRPRQLLNAIRYGDKSPNKPTFQAHNMPQQRLAEAAETVLGSKNLEPSFNQSVTGGALEVAAAFAHPPATLATLTGGYLYSRPGVQRFLTGQGVGQKQFIQRWDSLPLEDRVRFATTIQAAVRAGMDRRE